MTPRRLLRRLPRLLLVLMLALGLVVEPVLGVIGELHGGEHVAAAASADDAGHVHVHADAGHDHGGGDGPDDPDHAVGAHALMHFCGGTYAAIPDTALRIPPPRPAAIVGAAPTAPRLPGTRHDLPLRPPIG